MPVRRHTFVVQVREPDHVPMLENVRTHERVLLTDLAELSGQIERWLAADAEPPAGEGASVIGMPVPASAAKAGDVALGVGPGDVVMLRELHPEAERPPAPAAPEGEEPGPQLRRFSSPSGAD